MVALPLKEPGNPRRRDGDDTVSPGAIADLRAITILPSFLQAVTIQHTRRESRESFREGLFPRVCPLSCFLYVFRRRRNTYKKKKVFGDTPNPGKGPRPLHPRFRDPWAPCFLTKQRHTC